MKFATKLILLCSGLVSLTGLGIAYFAYAITTTTLESEVFRGMEDRAKSLLMNLDRMLFERLSNLKLFATDPVFCADGFPAHAEPAMDRLVVYRNTSKVYLSLSFFAMDGIRLVDTSGLDIGQRQIPEQFPVGFWNTTAQTGSGLGVDRSMTLDQNVVYVGGLVRCGADFGLRGVVVGRVALARLHEIFALNDRHDEKTTTIDLATRDGLLLYSNHNRMGVLKTRLSVPNVTLMTEDYHHSAEADRLIIHAPELGYLDFKGNGWFLKFAQPRSVALSRALDLRNQIILISFPSILLAVLISWFFASRFTGPINRLVLATRAIAAGDRSARADVQSEDEVGQLALDFNKMAQNIEEQDWIKSHLARFSEVIQKAETLDLFSQDVIRKLTPLLDGGHGVMYVLDEETKRYQLLGSYGYKERKNLSNAFAPGEGLVGQCVLEKQPILQTEAPSDYIRINSGLGEANPLTLLAIPLLFQNQVLAVIEIASFHRFTPIQQAFLEELSPTLGLGLENQNRMRRTEGLLEKTQAQAQEMTFLAEELQSQQEALNQSNKVLEERNHALQASEEEMKMQQEEIQANNKTLADRTQQLENQRDVLEKSQKEIEKKATELAQASRYKTEFLAILQAGTVSTFLND